LTATSRIQTRLNQRFARAAVSKIEPFFERLFLLSFCSHGCCGRSENSVSSPPDRARLQLLSRWGDGTRLGQGGHPLQQKLGWCFGEACVYLLRSPVCRRGSVIDNSDDFALLHASSRRRLRSTLRQSLPEAGGQTSWKAQVSVQSKPAANDGARIDRK